MTIDLEVAEELEAEQLIVRGRYRIYPADGGKPKDYTRATTWADTLEDSAQLRDWRCRMVAVGLGQRADLLELVQSTPTEDKDSLNVYCEQAVRVAEGDAKANRGTAAHGFFARILAGQFVDVPDSLRADIEAAIACLKRHELRPVVDMIEAVLVNEELGVAGRCDLVAANDHGRLRIVDLKSGAGLIEYAQLKTAMQLSIYAHADTVYDPDTRTHRPMPPVDQDVAYVLHRPLGTDTCDLIAVDIAAGWRYASEVVVAVKDARRHGQRKTDAMFSVVAEPDEGTTIADAWDRYHAMSEDEVADRETEKLRAWIVGRLAVLKQPDHAVAARDMKARWPAEIPGFKGDHVHTVDELRYIAQILDFVEAESEVPFGETDPTNIRPVSVAAEPVSVAAEPAPLRPVVDEGGYIGGMALHSLLTRVDELEPDVRIVIEGWAREGHAAGHTFSIKLVASHRRARIYEAVFTLVPLIDVTDEQQDLVRATVALVVPDAGQLAVPIGVALGQLTIGEAEHLAELARVVASSSPTLAYADDGTPRWVERF